MRMFIYEENYMTELYGIGDIIAQYMVNFRRNKNVIAFSVSTSMQNVDPN